MTDREVQAHRVRVDGTCASSGRARQLLNSSISCRCHSRIERLPSMQEVMDLMPSTRNKQGERERGRKEKGRKERERKEGTKEKGKEGERKRAREEGKKGKGVSPHRSTSTA